MEVDKRLAHSNRGNQIKTRKDSISRTGGYTIRTNSGAANSWYCSCRSTYMRGLLSLLIPLTSSDMLAVVLRAGVSFPLVLPVRRCLYKVLQFPPSRFKAASIWIKSRRAKQGATYTGLCERQHVFYAQGVVDEGFDACYYVVQKPGGRFSGLLPRAHDDSANSIFW